MTGRGKPAGPRRPTQEERRLFETAMGDVAPLAGRPTKTGPEAPDGEAPTAPPARREKKQPPAAAPAAKAPLPELRPGVAAGVDRRTFDRLRKGRIRPEARLDLHGMTRDAAHAALRAFIARAQADALRCVAVVTGKGTFREGGGVLQREAPLWLNRPDLRESVLGLCHAPPNDGGTGVLYILLRRKR